MLQKIKRFLLGTLLLTVIIFVVFLLLDLVHGNHAPALLLLLIAACLALAVNVLHAISKGTPPVLIFALGMAVIALGCTQASADKSDFKEFITIVRYEGCQYIETPHGIAHKGNCDNPIHVYNPDKK